MSLAACSTVIPISASPLITWDATSAGPSASASVTETPGYAVRNAPVRGATGSTASVGSAHRSSRPASSPPTADTAARAISTSRQGLARGADECLTGGGERHPAADAVEEGSAELGFELADRL